MVAKMTVKGGPETARAFDQLQQDVSDLHTTHHKVAQARLSGIASKTPVLTSALSQSWQASGDKDKASIASPLGYAMAQEYGTQFVPANHMIRDTLKAEQADLLREYETAILDRAKARGFRIA